MYATLCCIGTSLVVQTVYISISPNSGYLPSTCFECVRHFPPLGIHGSAQTKIATQTHETRNLKKLV